MVLTESQKEIQRKRKISKEVSADDKKPANRGGTPQDRLEFAKTRAGAGQETTLVNGKIESTTAEERRETEIKNIAQKSVDIEAQKGQLEQENLLRGRIKEEELNVLDVKEEIDPVTGEPLLSGGVSSAESLVTDIALLFTGGIIGKTALSFIGKKTAVSAAGQVGKLSTKTFPALGLKFTSNPKTISLTSSFLKKIALPSTLLATIGTYPFAGFIKEEALQTLSFAFKMAEDNNDIAGMEAAIREQEAALDPTGWNALFNKIPYANVLSQLNSFYKAARTKLDTDKRVFEKKANTDVRR